MNPQRIHEALEQIPYAEQQGFASVWFSEHHFRPVWSHNSAPDLTLAAVSQRTSRIRLGIGVVLAPIHHPLHVAARMATLDILSHGRVDVGLGRTGYPYQLTPYGTDLRDTRGMWQEFAEVLPRIWTQEEISLRRGVLPDPASGGPAEACAAPAPATVVRMRQRRDGAADGEPRDGRAVRQRRGPRPRPAADGALSGRAAGGPGQRGRARAARRADDGRLLPRGSAGRSPARHRTGGAGTSSNNASAPAWSGATTIRPPCRPIIRAITRATSASPVGRIRASRRPRRCVSKAPSSASARRRTASGFSKCTKPSVLRKCFYCVPSGRRSTEEVLHTIRLFGEEVIPHFQASEPRAVAARASA